jgi:hypothetical protein
MQPIFGDTPDLFAQPFYSLPSYGLQKRDPNSKGETVENASNEV